MKSVLGITKESLCRGSCGPGPERATPVPRAVHLIAASDEEKGSQHVLAESSPPGLNTAHGAESWDGCAHSRCGAIAVPRGSRRPGGSQSNLRNLRLDARADRRTVLPPVGSDPPGHH